jgi:hypothetical protein
MIQRLLRQSSIASKEDQFLWWSVCWSQQSSFINRLCFHAAKIEMVSGGTVGAPVPSFYETRLCRQVLPDFLIARASCVLTGKAAGVVPASPTSARATGSHSDCLPSSYDDGCQGGIVARLDVKSEAFMRPSGLPSSLMSTVDQSPSCTRILTFEFRGTRLSDLQF